MNRSLLLGIPLALALTSGVAWAKKPAPAPAPAPEAPAAPPVDPEAWRATPPGPGPQSDWAPPTAKVVTLSNGIPVYLVENPSLPLVSIRLVMTVGREANPAGKAGLASLTANMVDEGSTTMSAEAIDAKSSSLGANLGSGASDELSYVSLDALTGAELGPSLDLFADVALHPKFDSKVFTRIQGEALADIEAAKSEPRDVAARVYAAQLYGKNHPYGVPSVGDTASVKAIKVGDVKAFYKTWWHAGNAAIVVSGAMTEADVKAMLDPRFGTWKKGATTRPSVPAPATPIKTRVVFVEQPGAVQSVLRVGTVGVPRSSPEYRAADLAGTLVAGMFSSRINMNLREEHGWSYGAFGGFTENRDYGQFVVRGSVQADKTAPAVVEVLKELQAAMAKPPADADVAMAKEYLLKSLPGSFETNEATVGSFVSIPQFGLKPDLYQTYRTDLGALGPAQVATESARFFDPTHLLIVVAGPKTVETDDGKGGKVTVDVVKELQALGYEFVAI